MVHQVVMPTEVADQPRGDVSASERKQHHPPATLKPCARSSTPNSNRSRIVSLDRGTQARPSINDGNESDKSSSDGESSYFAKDLPTPKSGRYSFASDSGSISSAPARTPNVRKQSDASLSLSDDDDEVPFVATSSGDIYHGMSRMHSASSLVSSSEKDDHQRDFEPELQQLPEDRGITENHRPVKTLEYSPFPQASPPPISSMYHSAAVGYHPQPLPPDQLAGWTAAGNAVPNYGAVGGVDRIGRSLDNRASQSNNMPRIYNEGPPPQSNGLMAMASASQNLGGGGTPFSNGVGPNSNGLQSRDGNTQNGSGYREATPGAAQARVTNGTDSSAPAKTKNGEGLGGRRAFQVYWQRWIMLFYMSILNLLSDWTCYSVAPIATLTREAFGEIDPEQLVVVFLGANAISTACEPIILSRLGLRRTVVFGSLLLMLGSMVKSGGLPPILESNLEKGSGEWRVYLGFFLVGLSQPLYQCTPALLSASWFPECERTMATGVALNANQLGIGFAFIFGTLLVADSDDIVPYFRLLSMVSTLAFIGSLFQFDDAPPTPPSDTARVIRGTIEWRLPSPDTVWKSVRGIGGLNEEDKRPTRSSSGSTRRRPNSGRLPPSHTSSEAPVQSEINDLQMEARVHGVIAPSPMMPGAVGGNNPVNNESQATEESDVGHTNEEAMPPHGYPYPYGGMPYQHSGMYPGFHPGMVGPENYQEQPMAPQYYAYGAPYLPPMYQGYHPQANPYGVPYQQPHPYYNPYAQYNPYEQYPQGNIDELAEPTLTITDHHLDINIRDDQIVLSTKACFARPGFVHALITFTVSGIVINTLSTFMDYLVRLNGAGREYVGIVGGSFQFVIMISSLVIGKQTDTSRAYYSVTIAMLVLGAFALAECGVSLDADRGGDLRWSLIIVAALVGPLQPVSTELGVEVAYPLSENTVLVIQQLFSNLLSALFIPFFKALKDVGTERIVDSSELYERPQYTFSFYLLIVLHAAVTVFFATFNGRYLRYEHELVKKEREEQEDAKRREEEWNGAYVDEKQPLARGPVM